MYSQISNMKLKFIYFVFFTFFKFPKALARIHAQMTSIDPGAEVIDVARKHLNLSCDEQLSGRVNYRNESIEEHLKEDSHCGKYDAVVVSEVIEHVIDKTAFLQSCVATLKV